jgi:hypothetical protein
LDGGAGRSIKFQRQEQQSQNEKTIIRGIAQSFGKRRKKGNINGTGSNSGAGNSP